MRYSVYVAAAVLVFFVAASVGAAAGLVAGWQLGPGATGSGGAMTTTEGGDRETTGDARASEDAVSEAAADEVSFILRTTDGNSRGD